MLAHLTIIIPIDKLQICIFGGRNLEVADRERFARTARDFRGSWSVLGDGSFDTVVLRDIREAKHETCSFSTHLEGPAGHKVPFGME